LRSDPLIQANAGSSDDDEVSNTS